MSVFTIGHSTHAIESFVGLLERHGVGKVADVRSTPYSRFNPQFNRESLARGLVSCTSNTCTSGASWADVRRTRPARERAGPL